MKQFFGVISIAILGLLMGCQRSVDVKKAAEELLETDRAFAAASRASNAAEAFNQYLAADAIELPAGRHPVVSRDSIYARMKQNADQYLLDWSPQRAEVAQSGELGWTWGTWTLTFSDEEGTPQTRYGKYLNIWRKQADGNWKVIVDMDNASPTPEGVKN